MRDVESGGKTNYSCSSATLFFMEKPDIEPGPPSFEAGD